MISFATSGRSVAFVNSHVLNVGAPLSLKNSIACSSKLCVFEFAKLVCTVIALNIWSTDVVPSLRALSSHRHLHTEAMDNNGCKDECVHTPMGTR